MTTDELLNLVGEMVDKEEELLKSKGKDYSGDKDTLQNFKSLSLLMEITPLQVWGVYFLKHVLAIMQFIKDKRLCSEPIDGRITDARNYLALLQALIEEKKEIDK